MNKRQKQKNKNQKIRQRIECYEIARTEAIKEGQYEIVRTCEHYIAALYEALRM